VHGHRGASLLFCTRESAAGSEKRETAASVSL
jgi:hypothetical protein